mmetsp:Transcript_22856/g.48613  ORF Transcript_22856/g.48613 Transcript_22856/m.48613 type:complete len:328 (-) Transcript_22856:53-1036(-)|eukprot:CAMPEP_0201183598 /NCGR_PEP_ID=MMETSP0851-20130426/124091_1 /ASSEMBLY_ACC=CAM_ASM_000631 /TAXON_ID=183588 /ORGANISM="Pseudo-nitzschia fraudulenta, Strain WWA7" /LENGTH=327 /DNA_ID=CAMNT_0047468391 /DNA_START=139 /DNA_END=1122 /DNA_ORIENTATION=+
MADAISDATSPPFRMVALDLDGTLLQSDHQLANKQAEYLRDLRKSGFRICIATGRAAPSVYDIVKKLALPDPTPVVCSNGARGLLLSYKNASAAEDQERLQEELFYNPVSREAVIKTIELAKELGYFVQYYIDDDIYANPTTESHLEMVKQYETLTGSNVIPINDDFDRFIGSNEDDKLPSKLLVRCASDEFATCDASFERLMYRTNDNGKDGNNKATTERLAHIVKAYSSYLGWFLEILHPGVNKGNGLGNMCQKLDVSLNDVVAMGDGTNDVEFLQMSGLGIAMNNAHESLRKVASYTIEWTNDEDGVMKALETLKSEGKLYCNK